MYIYILYIQQIWTLILNHLFFVNRESLQKRSTFENVDLIYNGLSDTYETLYPVLDNVNNEGGMRLLQKSELGSLKVSGINY